jgi:PTS system ascorbate-specific IIA component
MAGLLIVAHTPLASSLKAVARHVYPCETDVRVEAYDMPADIDMDLAHAQIQALVEAVRDPQALVLVDVVGASPSNVANWFDHETGVRVVAGVNVAMLLRSMCYSWQDIDELAETAIVGGSAGIQKLNPPGPQNQGCQGPQK